MDDEIRVLSPTAILGYGFPEKAFRRGLDLKPHVIAVDAGSTDPGPFYLGDGVSFTDRKAVRRDLALILAAGRLMNIPVIIGSAGGAGAAQHVAWTEEIVRDICEEQGLSGSLAIIRADIDPAAVLECWRNGSLQSLTHGHPISEADILDSTNIVAQMGHEPLIGALERGADVVLAGRCYDPAVSAALPILKGFDPGLALHMGKILECAAIAALPGSGSDCMFGTLRSDCFILEPLSGDRVCTVESVAGHTLYEKSNPYILPGPGGALDLSACRFEQVDERRVRVSGSRLVPDERYMIKLEGAKPAGFRTVSIAGARDPRFIASLDAILDGVTHRTRDNFPDISPDSFRQTFHIYGRDGVMGEREPNRTAAPHEIGIVIDVVARSQELADTICGFTRSTLLHFGYPGRLSTGGNLALPYSPSDFRGGQVYAFSLYHLMPAPSPTALFECRFSRLEDPR